MRVLLNATGGTHGVSATARYVRNLVRWLPEVCGSHEVTAFEFRWRSVPYSATLPNSALSTIHWPVPPRIGEQVFQHCPGIGAWLLGGPFDILHLLDNLPLDAKARFRVATVHQGGPLCQPSLFPPSVVDAARGWLHSVAQRTDLLVAVSRTLGDALASEHGIPSDRVAAVPLGVDPIFSPPGEGEREQKMPPYVLYVGRINHAKNVPTLCRAFQALAARHADLRLVLLGWPDVARGTVDEWLGSDSIRRRVDLLAPLPPDSEQLRDWYRGALVFIFPSLAEGWASPPLEAMACGTPVVTSNVSSLPETVGGAALQVDPLDHEALAGAAERLMGDAGLRTEMIARGREWAAQFTWERTARETWRAYGQMGSCP